jgi:putative transposase
MQLAHKIELKPNNKQRTYFKKACGVSRFSWNWALAHWNSYFEFNQQLPKEDRENISGYQLKKEFNAIKKEEFPWVKEVTKYAAQQPFLQLDVAYKRYFKGVSHRPRFKKRDKSKDSFYVGGDQIKIKDKRIWVPNLGLVKLKEKLRFAGKINSATFSRTANRWFVSIQVDLLEEAKKCQTKKTIGVDLGINKMAMFSDSTYVKSPKPLKKNLRRLARYQRKLKKKKFKSKNYFKQKNKVAKIHMRISNIRKDVLHKTTTYLTKSFQKISIEDLHIKGMLKNHKLARAISDIGFGEFRRQLEYKSDMRGNVLFVADRFYPSSKKCSSCEKVKQHLTLKDRMFSCRCGFSIDRDLNAAINLEKLVNKNVRQALSKLTPVEITAIFGFKNIQETRIEESGIKQQIYVDRFA